MHLSLSTASATGPVQSRAGHKPEIGLDASASWCNCVGSSASSCRAVLSNDTCQRYLPAAISSQHECTIQQATTELRHPACKCEPSDVYMICTG